MWSSAATPIATTLYPDFRMERRNDDALVATGLREDGLILEWPPRHA